MTVRVGVCGYMHEVNALAAPVTIGHGLEASRTEGGLAATWEAGMLIRRLREVRPDVDVVDLPVWEFGASGPLDDADFRAIVLDVSAALRAAGPLDAVAVLGHGAGRTTVDLDPDATFFRAVRDVVGERVPIVVVLDFHANLSAEMCDLCDVLVGYRTNPHVDIQDRLAEAADHVLRLVERPGTVVARCKLPMVLPQIAQGTAANEPLGEVVALGQRLVVPPVRNVSVLGGFSLSDVPDCGVSVCVTADPDGAEAAGALAAELAAAAWARRDRYRLGATPLADSVAIAARAARGETEPVILADVSDNPGGGAPGNSTFVLDALLAAGVDGVVLGLLTDPDVVAAAWEAGVGATIDVEFNRGSTAPMARPLAVTATVLSLVDAPLVPTKGVYDGSLRHPGRCCALAIGGLRVGVCSHKVQCADDDTLLHVGLDPAAARVVVVKSRGHFRAGFAHLFPDDRIVEVGAPGVATVDLASVEWEHLPHPVFPLDEVGEWAPQVTLHRGSAA